jgi:hypothetical protein
MVAVDRIIATWLRAWSDGQPYDHAMEMSYRWRGPFEDAEINALHAEGFGHPVRTTSGPSAARRPSPWRMASSYSSAVERFARRVRPSVGGVFGGAVVAIGWTPGAQAITVGSTGRA